MRKLGNIYIDEAYDLTSLNNVCSNAVFSELTDELLGKQDAFIDSSFKNFQLDHNLKPDGGVVSLNKAPKKKPIKIGRIKYQNEDDINREITNFGAELSAG